MKIKLDKKYLSQCSEHTTDSKLFPFSFALLFLVALALGGGRGEVEEGIPVMRLLQ